uniref:Nucleoside diphosphate kinase-like domain-containing protein n=1 Tax=Coturnix japonica TaxID=93934 RepID=A0A8C2TQR3_COTJA
MNRVRLLYRAPISASYIYITEHGEAYRVTSREFVPPNTSAYGLTDSRNTTHGSDSPASASREIAFFFPEFNEQLWYQQEEPRLRCGQMYYNAEKRVHCVIRDEETDLT